MRMPVIFFLFIGANMSLALRPPRPGYEWAAYCKSIDGYLSLEFALARVPANDWVLEEIPLPAAAGQTSQKKSSSSVVGK
jgi:hypothetical protein